MSTTTAPIAPADLGEEATAWAVGGGIITMALFPLALPIILLTAATVIPLLLIPLALGLTGRRRCLADPARARPVEMGQLRAAPRRHRGLRPLWPARRDSLLSPPSRALRSDCLEHK
jgi:hypothetical protein